MHITLLKRCRKGQYAWGAEPLTAGTHPPGSHQAFSPLLLQGADVQRAAAGNGESSQHISTDGVVESSSVSELEAGKELAHVIPTAADTWWRALLTDAPPDEVLQQERPPTSYYFVAQEEEA